MLKVLSLFANLLVPCYVLLVCQTTTAVETSFEKTAASPPQVLYLHTEFLPYPDAEANTIPDPLIRELIRQALLIAARDELRLPTCDETLRETSPDSPEVIHLILSERIFRDGRWVVRLYAFDPVKRKRAETPLWEHEYQYEQSRHKTYANMVETLQEDMPKGLSVALRQAGFRQQPAQQQAELVESDQFESMLSKVDFIAQFAAVRSAHQTIAVHGETPDLLGNLVRGYANLAMLTRHQHNSVSKVFTARAWLYAQRLTASSRENNFSLWHRAYAWAWGGMLHHAIADIEHIKEHQKNIPDDSAETEDSTTAPDLPSWTTLIEPYSMSDRAATKAVGETEESLKPWATRLWFELTSTFQHDIWNYHAGLEVAEIIPTAYGVYAAMTSPGAGLRSGRSGAYWAPFVFGQHAPQSLDIVPGMPKAIREFLPTNAFKRSLLSGVFKDPNSEDAFSAAIKFIAKQLRDESRKISTGDLSWSALAYLLEEEQFVQIANYLSISKNATESSFIEIVDSVLPLIEKHRYAAYIDSYRYNKRHEAKEIEQTVAALKFEDPRHNMRRMFRHLWSVKGHGETGLGKIASSQASLSYTMKGILEYFFTRPSAWNKSNTSIDSYYLRAFSTIVPKSEIGVRFSIHIAKEPTAEQLKEWESGLTEDATAYIKLGNYYYWQKDLENAARCYGKSLEKLPEFKAAKYLAYTYWDKDFDKWEKPLLDFLKTEDNGLAHAHAHDKLVEGYVYYGLWDRAKPHALAAGQTWSAWGLKDAAFVCEALADWEESETWIREMSESYPTSSGKHWYYWCQRTGRGDVRQAELIAEKYFSSNFSKQTRTNQISLGVYHLLLGDLKSALKFYHKAQDFYPSFSCTFMIAQLARQLEDEKTREDVLQVMEEAAKQKLQKKEYNQALYDAGMEILELLKSGDASPEKVKALEEKLTKIEDDARCAFAYFVGKELEILGQTELADIYLGRAVIMQNNDYNYATLAGNALAKRLGTSRPDNNQLGADNLWPARKDVGQPEE